MVYELTISTTSMPAKHVSKRYIIILLTGVPGTGKTTLARELAPLLDARVLPEKKFATQKGVGSWNPETREYDVDVSALRKKILSHLRKTKHNLVIEGHLSCEFSLPVSAVVVTHAPRGTLEKRLRSRHYSEVKIQDNLLCEEQSYVERAVKKNYPRTHTLSVSTHRPKKGVARTVLRWIQLNTTIE